MKTKRILLAALTAVCALLLFSSCNKQEPTDSVYYYYQVTGKFGGVGGLGGMYTLGSFQDAIDAAVGKVCKTMEDAKVIAACDGLDAKIKADTGTKYSGNVKINRYKSNENGFTTIKEYNY